MDAKKTGLSLHDMWSSVVPDLITNRWWFSARLDEFFYQRLFGISGTQTGQVSNKLVIKATIFRQDNHYVGPVTAA